MATIIPNARGGKIVSYKFRAFLGRDETGKQITRYSTWPVPEDMSPTKGRRAAEKVAELWEKQAHFEYAQDVQNPERVKAREIEKDRTPFSSFVLNDWFPICIDNGEHKPKTVSFYNDTVKNLVVYFGRTPLQKITAIAIQKFIIYLRTEKGFAPQTVHHHYRTLNMIFAYARKQEIILKNPMDKVDPPKLAKKQVDALSPEAAKELFLCVK